MRAADCASNRGATVQWWVRGFAAWVCVTASPVAAQDIHGVVRDSSSSLPIAGALVSLLDSARHEVAKTLTDRQGHYVLRGARAGLELQVLHIGHLPIHERLTGAGVGPGASAAGLGAGGLANIRMARIPYLLDAMETAAARPIGELAVCPARADESLALAYWNQARTEAQEAFVVRDSSPGPVRLAIYYRDVDPSSGRVTQQSVIVHDEISPNPALATRSEMVFPDVGRLHDSHVGESQSVVYGAGIDLLIDDHFTRRHCFHMAQADERHRGEIGVAFGPGKSQLDFPDMAGVLWMDPSEHAVRTVEFTYVSNLSPTPLAGNLGGLLRYRLLPSGAGLIESWSERLAPEVMYRSGMAWVVASPTTTLETGAELLSAAWPDSTRWVSSTGLTGRVVCGPGSIGVPRVHLRLAGTPYSVATDSAGSFAFTGVVPGPYQLSVGDVQLVRSRGDTINVTVVRDSTVRLDLPVRAARCGGQAAGRRD